jgi:uncharacterized protein
VKAVDTNVLVYAHRREANEHDVARQLVKSLAEGPNRWAIPWPCLYEFFSVVTNRRIWGDGATPPERGWAQIHAWADSPSVVLLSEPPGFHQLLESFLTRPRVTGPIVHDARVAALCVAYGVDVLISRDRDFQLFPELRLENPF